MITRIFVLFILSTVLLAQPTPWEWQDPYPTASLLRDVAFLGDDALIVVGYYGAILKSTDGGTSWQDISRIHASFEDVYFLDENTGWAVGNQVCGTNDGGDTWTFLAEGFNGSLIDVQFVNKQVGFTCSSEEAYSSNDGGNTWHSMFKPGEQYIRDMVFLDAQTGWLATHMHLYKTTDGGATWILCDIALPAEPRQILFVDADHGFIRLISTFLLKTNDGGKTWQTLQTDFKSTRHIFFLDSQIGWLSSSSGLCYTNDGGKNWIPRHIPVSPYKMFFSDSLRGYTVGSPGGIIFRTDDGGDSWTPLYTSLNQYYSASFFLDTQHGWAAGSAVVKTTDGGGTWELAAKTGNQYSSIHFTSLLFGWSVADGKLFKTADSGVTWDVIETPTENKLTKVWGVNSQTVCAVGASGTIVLSEDNGEIWHSVGPNDNSIDEYQLEAIFFLDEKHGWIGGRKRYKATWDLGITGRTTDGGKTWTFHKGESLGDIAGIASIQFFDQLNGICCGYSEGAVSSSYGKIYSTNDGGRTWKEISMNNKFTYRGFYFVSPDIGWILGEYIGDGTLFFTTDGGKTVQPELIYSNRMRGIYGLDGHVWVATDNGILHRSYSPTVQVEIHNIKPQFFRLQNYPNPFNPSTTIQFELPESGTVSLKIYNIQGRAVYDAGTEYLAAGQHSRVWSGENSAGEQVAAGVYLYRVEYQASSGEKQVMMKKMSLVR